jgi:hypothetical protein
MQKIKTQLANSHTKFDIDLRFIKEDNRWYIDMPDFIDQGYGTKGNLEMVQGADELCEHLADGEDFVEINVSSVGKPDTILKCDRIASIMPIGRYYDVYNHNQTLVDYTFVSTMWLCPVTKYVFGGKYPKQFFINSIN